MLSCDTDTNIEDEFFTALALFKSTTRNSEVKLREMLLTSIAKRKKFFNHDKKIPFPASAYENINQKSTKLAPTNGKQFENSNIQNNSINGESQIDSMEIPTISIPDEEFNDFITCKICDGAKIGPFILLECQDCLDTYHPLCHQPPVQDIDVYDPRLVWRCSGCTGIEGDISSEITLILNSMDKNDNINNDDNSKLRRIDEDTLIRKSNSPIKIKNYSFPNNNIEEREITKEVTKEEYSSSGNQFRKRIGSKLTVSRTNSKS